MKLACQEGKAPGAAFAEKLKKLETYGFEGVELNGAMLLEAGGVDERVAALKDSPLQASSICGGSVPEFVSPERRTHAFAVFYTGGSVAGATGPFLAGLLGDVVGLPIALAAVACIALTTVPMVWALRPAFRS